MRVAGLVIVISFASSPALADRPPHAAWGFAYTVGHGGTVDAFDLGWRLEPGIFGRIGRWELTLSAPTEYWLSSSDAARDGAGPFVGVGASGRLDYRVHLDGHGILAIGGGLSRRWVIGEGMVTRTCHQTLACVAGKYTESPHYHAWAPQLRIGIGAEAGMLYGATFDVIVESYDFVDVPTDGAHGIAVIGSLTGYIGWGR